jgi:hypothetical protein
LKSFTAELLVEFLFKKLNYLHFHSFVAPNLNKSCPATTWYSNATTIAGSSLGECAYTPTSLCYPHDLFVDKNNTIYVLDSLNCRVQHFQPQSTIGTTVINVSYCIILNQFALSNSSDIQSICRLFLLFILVTAISIDLSNNIYILDSDNNCVMKWKPGAMNGTIVAGSNENGITATQLNNPYGMFVEPNSLIIWIADTGNSRIVRWENSSTGIIVCGSYGTEAHQFNNPYGIFVNTDDLNTFYVADTINHRIQMWLQGATNGTTVAGQTGVCGDGLNQLCYPSSVVGDTNGNIYIVELGNNRIMQWKIGSTSGVIIAGSSTYGVLPNQLYSPYNIKLDSDRALIVADTYNNRIQKFSILCGKF